ncbi:MAG: esterase [Flavobacterium sp. BFFFF1]|uniref:alpha/beta hydrolase n=1 Tax=unclassified Flavobacterium TaxID=196869 RepID=UPI000BD20C5B|nr:MULTISPECIES: alpha/beta hydrolase family protein [unclassified Flavobacterium]OYU79072.1 MAG: esterase [Flavobacterium sp. BFFFF1]
MKKMLFLCIGLTMMAASAFAAKVDTLEIRSQSMDRVLKAAVAVPDSYAKSKANYPVMYLLHGAYGHFRDWLKNTPDLNTVKDLADEYNMIIVMPEGETFSFYIDSPTLKTSQFETFITKEVIAKIDATYRTVATKNGRVITGLSMGGHGALYLSAKHPELYCGAGSMSGALDMGKIRKVEQPDEVNKLFVAVYGPTPPSDAELQSHAVIGMIDQIKANKMPLIIDIGVDDFLIESNRAFHSLMVYEKIPHEYTERPGSHTWQYWQDAVPFHALFFARIFKQNGSAVK